ncbi:hypothetical protein AB0G05_12160 [Nonomuraea wenchangensis]
MTPEQDLAPTRPADPSASSPEETPPSQEGPSSKPEATSPKPDPTSPKPEPTSPKPEPTSPKPVATPAPPSPAPEATPASPSPETEGTPAPPSPDPEGTPAGAEGKRRRVVRAKLAGAMAAMLVVALAATAGLQWFAAARADEARTALEAERALRLEVSGAASAFSTSLLSYDYRDLQSTRSTLSTQATGDFLTTYDTAFGGAMAQVIVKLKAVAQATVREVYLADVDEATAHAIVVVDQQVNTSEAIRSVKDSHLKIALVKEKGIWKVRDVTVLGAASDDQYALDDGKKKD